MKIYKTVQGDTFDIIAKKFYGNETRVAELMGANHDSIGTIVFPAGVTIHIPEIEEKAAAESVLPPWRKS